MFQFVGCPFLDWVCIRRQNNEEIRSIEHAAPSKYPDLVVRVTGYSAYFKSLSPEYRQQVVDRILGTNVPVQSRDSHTDTVYC